jgi:hypothetical protein
MKSLLTSALLGLAGVALFTSSANAQTTITSNLGDVILGFRATSGTGAASNLEVDLGNVSQFYNAAPGSIINLNGTAGLALQDIINTYGPNWATDVDPATSVGRVLWGVASTDGAAPTADGHATARAMWVTDPEITPGTLNAPWFRGTTLQVGGPVTKIETLEVNGAAGTIDGATSTANSNVSAVINSTTQGSWSSEDLFNIGSSFGYFVPTIDNNLATSSDANGNSVSDFYELQTSTTRVPGKILGQFVLNSTTGNFEFIAAPVPEPSAMGLMAVGFLSLIGMVVVRRRRSIVA